MPTTYPEVQTTVVIWDLSKRKLRYFSNDHDELLAGSILQRSTDVGNKLILGTDGGLLVSENPTEAGSLSSTVGTSSSYSVAVVFSETYTVIPILTLTAEYVSGKFPILRFENLTLSGFIFHADEVTGANLDAMNFTWKTN